MAEVRIKKKPPPQRTSWRTGDLLRAAIVFSAVYVGLQLLWTAHLILFVAFLGILFGLAIASGVDRLQAWGLPRGVGAVVVVLALFGIFFLFGTIMAPTVREQARELQIQLPEAIDRLESWIEEQDGIFRVFLPFDVLEEEDPPAAPEEAIDVTEPPGIFEAEPDTLPTPPTVDAVDPEDELETGVREQIMEQLGGLGRHLFAFLTSTVAVLGSLLLILFIAIYFAVDPDSYRRGVLLLVPRQGRQKAADVMEETSMVLRRWLVTQLITMVVIGVVTTVTLLLLDVRAAVALGIIAGLLEFIPIFGPIIAAVPAIAMGFLESPTTGLYVTLAYIVIQQLESQILVPLLMKEGVDLPPVLTVLIQALMALIFGFIGLLVAVPLLAAAVVVIKMLYVQDVVGDKVILPTDAYDSS